VWSSLLELAGFVPEGELGGEALAAGSQAVHDTPGLNTAMKEVFASPDRREQLHRRLVDLMGHGQEVLGRWADVVVNSGTYAEIVDRPSSSKAASTGGAACSASPNPSRSI
jgi:hypothetical protein